MRVNFVIDTKKIRIFNAFTLAETLITMVIVALVALFSVPVIKKSRVVMEHGVDKNYWNAYYKGDTLYVCSKNEGGSESCTQQAAGVDTVQFTPPAGVNRFNVTVVGGGGGGAAGFANNRSVRDFHADSKVQLYKIPATGVYKIVAIGGGGGGAGGASDCDGGSGVSAGGVIASANLTKDDILSIYVGNGGTPGTYSKFSNDHHGSINKMAVKGNVYKETKDVIAYAVGMKPTDTIDAVTERLSTYLSPSADAQTGGGHGLSTVINGPNLKIVAQGGAGGRYYRLHGARCKAFRREESKKEPGNKSVRKRYYLSADKFPKSDAIGSVVDSASVKKVDYNKAPTKCDETDGNVDRQYVNDEKTRGDSDFIRCLRKYRVFCLNGTNITGGTHKNFCSELKNLRNYSLSTYGDGGEGAKKKKTGNRGSNGFVRITEIGAYGGGGGQAGTVSVYTFDHSPLEAGHNSVDVKIGKGGVGGVAGHESARFQNGQDGGFSRFGTKIIAQGGEGGKVKAVGATLDSTYTTGTKYVAKGDDGLPVSLSKSMLSRVGISDALEVFNGSFSIGQGSQTKDYSTAENYGNPVKANPGIGGGGGGATYENDVASAFGGGNGASGIVLVTW